MSMEMMAAKVPRIPKVDIVVAGTPSRLATLSRASLRISSFRPPPEQAPLVPVPHTIATAPLSPESDLRIIALPLVPAYSPVWPLVISRAYRVVRIDAASAAHFEEACTAMGKAWLEIEDLVPSFSEEDEDAVESLVRAALERDALAT